MSTIKTIDIDKLVEEIMYNFREYESSCHNYTYSEVESIYDSICTLIESAPEISKQEKDNE